MINYNQPPGTIVYTGQKKSKDIQIRYIEFNKSSVREESFTPENLIIHPSNKDIIQWYDISGLHNINLIHTIGQNFGMHPLVSEDIVDVRQRPSFNEYPEGIFMTLKHIDYLNTMMKKENISIYFGEAYVLTFHEHESDIFGHLRERITSGKGRLRTKKADYLAYAVVDSIVDDYYKTISQLEEKIELLEEKVSLSNSNIQKFEIFSVKKHLLQFRKSVVPVRDLINSFSRSESKLIDAKTKFFIKDVYDHTVHIMDNVDAHRDIISGIQDLYNSEISIKMNKIMQFLTVTTAIFVPLSFLTGVYGMNFEIMPELKLKFGYFILWGIMLLISIVIIFIFKKRKWL